MLQLDESAISEDIAAAFKSLYQGRNTGVLEQEQLDALFSLYEKMIHVDSKSVRLGSSTRFTFLFKCLHATKDSRRHLSLRVL